MPATDTTDAEPRPPKWTTGQGIGFLTALPGVLILIAAALAATFGDLPDRDYEIGAAVFASMGLGAAMVVPGAVVFYKCKRPVTR